MNVPPPPPYSAPPRSVDTASDSQTGKHLFVSEEQWASFLQTQLSVGFDNVIEEVLVEGFLGSEILQRCLQKRITDAIYRRERRKKLWKSWWQNELNSGGYGARWLKAGGRGGSLSERGGSAEKGNRKNGYAVGNAGSDEVSADSSIPLSAPHPEEREGVEAIQGQRHMSSILSPPITTNSSSTFQSSSMFPSPSTITIHDESTNSTHPTSRASAMPKNAPSYNGSIAITSFSSSLKTSSGLAVAYKQFVEQQTQKPSSSPSHSSGVPSITLGSTHSLVLPFSPIPSSSPSPSAALSCPDHAVAFFEPELLAEENSKDGGSQLTRDGPPHPHEGAENDHPIQHSVQESQSESATPRQSVGHSASVRSSSASTLRTNSTMATTATTGSTSLNKGGVGRGMVGFPGAPPVYRPFSSSLTSLSPSTGAPCPSPSFLSSPLPESTGNQAAWENGRRRRQKTLEEDTLRGEAGEEKVDHEKGQTGTLLSLRQDHVTTETSSPPYHRSSLPSGFFSLSTRPPPPQGVGEEDGSPPPAKDGLSSAGLLHEVHPSGPPARAASHDTVCSPKELDAKKRSVAGLSSFGHPSPSPFLLLSPLPPPPPSSLHAHAPRVPPPTCTIPTSPSPISTVNRPILPFTASTPSPTTLPSPQPPAPPSLRRKRESNTESLSSIFQRIINEGKEPTQATTRTNEEVSKRILENEKKQVEHDGSSSWSVPAPSSMRLLPHSITKMRNPPDGVVEGEDETDDDVEAMTHDMEKDMEFTRSTSSPPPALFLSFSISSTTAGREMSPFFSSSASTAPAKSSAGLPIVDPPTLGTSLRHNGRRYPRRSHGGAKDDGEVCGDTTAASLLSSSSPGCSSPLASLSSLREKPGEESETVGNESRGLPVVVVLEGNVKECPKEEVMRKRNNSSPMLQEVERRGDTTALQRLAEDKGEKEDRGTRQVEKGSSGAPEWRSDHGPCMASSNGKHQGVVTTLLLSNPSYSHAKTPLPNPHFSSSLASSSPSTHSSSFVSSSIAEVTSLLSSVRYPTRRTTAVKPPSVEVIDHPAENSGLKISSVDTGSNSPLPLPFPPSATWRTEMESTDGFWTVVSQERHPVPRSSSILETRRVEREKEDQLDEPHKGRASFLIKGAHARDGGVVLMTGEELPRSHLQLPLAERPATRSAGRGDKRLSFMTLRGSEASGAPSRRGSAARIGFESSVASPLIYVHALPDHELHNQQSGYNFTTSSTPTNHSYPSPLEEFPSSCEEDVFIAASSSSVVVLGGPLLFSIDGDPQQRVEEGSTKENETQEVPHKRRKVQLQLVKQNSKSCNFSPSPCSTGGSHYSTSSATTGSTSVNSRTSGTLIRGKGTSGVKVLSHTGGEMAAWRSHMDVEDSHGGSSTPVITPGNGPKTTCVRESSSVKWKTVAEEEGELGKRKPHHAMPPAALRSSSSPPPPYEKEAGSISVTSRRFTSYWESELQQDAKECEVTPPSVQHGVTEVSEKEEGHIQEGEVSGDASTFSEPSKKPVSTPINTAGGEKEKTIHQGAGTPTIPEAQDAPHSIVVDDREEERGEKRNVRTQEKKATVKSSEINKEETGVSVSLAAESTQKRKEEDCGGVANKEATSLSTTNERTPQKKVAEPQESITESEAEHGGSEKHDSTASRNTMPSSMTSDQSVDSGAKSTISWRSITAEDRKEEENEGQEKNSDDPIEKKESNPVERKRPSSAFRPGVYIAPLPHEEKPSAFRLRKKW